jgi:hypothetical protein
LPTYKGDEGDMGENGQDGDSFFTQIGSEVSLKGENDLVVTGNIKATGNIKVGIHFRKTPMSY